jgi:hypothetical protein
VPVRGATPGAPDVGVSAPHAAGGCIRAGHATSSPTPGRAHQAHRRPWNVGQSSGAYRDIVVRPLRRFSMGRAFLQQVELGPHASASRAKNAVARFPGRSYLINRDVFGYLGQMTADALP